MVLPGAGVSQSGQAISFMLIGALTTEVDKFRSLTVTPNVWVIGPAAASVRLPTGGVLLSTSDVRSTLYPFKFGANSTPVAEERITSPPYVLNDSEIGFPARL